MKVYLVFEDNHGLIGVAETAEAAIRFLVHDSWIDENTEFCDYRKMDTWKSIGEVLSPFLATNKKDKIFEYLKNNPDLLLFQDSEIGIHIREEEVYS